MTLVFHLLELAVVTFVGAFAWYAGLGCALLGHDWRVVPAGAELPIEPPLGATSACSRCTKWGYR